MSSCELHSRSLAVGRTGARAILRLRTRGLRNLEIAHTCYAISRLRTHVMQSRDCLRNLGIPRMCNAISRLRKFPDCAEHIRIKLESEFLLIKTSSFHHAKVWSSKCGRALEWMVLCVVLAVGPLPPMSTSHPPASFPGLPRLQF